MGRSRIMRVDPEFHKWLNEIAKENGTSIMNVSRELRFYHKVNDRPFKLARAKRGSFVADMALYTIILFALGLFIVFGFKLMTTIDDDFQSRSDLSDTSKNHMSDLKGRFVNLFDGIFVTVLIFLLLAIGVGAYYLNLHPVFYVPAILIGTFIIIISAVFANVFNDIGDAAEIQNENDSFTLLPFIMQHYVKFITVAIFLLVIVMYAKQREGQ